LKQKKTKTTTELRGSSCHRHRRATVFDLSAPGDIGADVDGIGGTPHEKLGHDGLVVTSIIQ
jgi:hypothetical protein